MITLRAEFWISIFLHYSFNIILILSSHLYLSIQSGLYSTDFQQKRMVSVSDLFGDTACKTLMVTGRVNHVLTIISNGKLFGKRKCFIKKWCSSFIFHYHFLWMNYPYKLGSLTRNEVKLLKSRIYRNDIGQFYVLWVGLPDSSGYVFIRQKKRQFKFSLN